MIGDLRNEQHPPLTIRSPHQDIMSNLLNMPPHKRLRTVPATAPRKSARLAVTGEDSSSRPSITTARPSRDHFSSKKANGNEKSLSGSALIQEVAKMVENKEAAELMILELM